MFHSELSKISPQLMVKFSPVSSIKIYNSAKDWIIIELKIKYPHVLHQRDGHNVSQCLLFLWN